MRGRRGMGRGVAAVAALLASVGLGLPSVAQAAAGSDTSPVNLATPVDLGAAVAARGATVTAGDARFQVLDDGLIRMEYSPTGTFENLPTVNVLHRRFAVPPYQASVSNGWLTVTTSAVTLRYRVGSGPFGPDNVTVANRVAGAAPTATPEWESECPFDQACQSGAAALAGPAAINTDHSGYQSVAGFIAGLAQGNEASATWTVLGAPAGDATVTVRYANYIGALGGPASRTIDLTVNGTPVTTLTLPPTPSWDSWSTVSATVPLTAGTDKVGVACGSSDSCTVNVDTLTVSPPAAPVPAVADPGYLGGWTRGFDSATYGPRYSCPPGTPTASQCSAALPSLHPGLLDRAGWRLLDDTKSAVWTPDGWVQPRPGNGDVQDGYLFVYGHDYLTALKDLNRLTGPSTLLPESAFGVWYSDYHAYSASDYEDSLIPAFRASHVPVDTLSVDTDWKSPNQWNGWEWNPNLFPDPSAFLAWAHSQGIHVTLNIHASIAGNDPKLAQAQSVASTPLADASCFSGPCKVWDWSQPSQAESYFSLQQPFEQQGNDFWWLDWCCDNSTVSMPGLTPDNWINHLHAQEMLNKGQRGFVLSRIGSSYQNPDEVYPAGPWASHTSTLAFTGDTWGTWNTLAFQAQLSQDEASIGQPYVSNDIGSFLGPPPGNPNDDPDLYARWVQQATFSPILRLHSSDGNRLPWDYPQPAGGTAASFLRLHEALVPYTYSLAADSAATGAPMTRPLYLDYPDQAGAYANPAESLYGPDVLVAPVTTPGAVSTERVWFPPGRWTDWFTGATFTGPGTQTLTVPLDRMPVFVKDGGIVPEAASGDNVASSRSAPLTLRVYPGEGSFSLYQDAGSGLGYQHGQSSQTAISSTSSPGSSAHPVPCGARRPAATGPAQTGTSSVVIGPACGTYPGQAATRSFSVHMEDLSAPRAVLLDGRPLAEGGSSGWAYDATTHTVTVPVSSLPLDRGAVVTQVGGTPVDQAEPAAVALSLNPATPLTLNPGQSTTVTSTETNDGPGTASGLAVSMTAPSGWTVTPASPVAGGDLTQGGSTSQPWTVTAPSGGSAPVSGAVTATATYTSAGLPEQVTAGQQAPPAAAPLPPPVISSVSPNPAAPGATVTLTGQNFGATQGSSYLTLAQGGTSWGAPYDGAKLTITNWSENSITFQLPPDSGPYPLTPGPATVTVTVAGQTSPAANLTVSGSTAPAPALTSVTPSTTPAGSTVTLTGQNFGASQGSSYVLLVQGNTSWGAPYDGATFPISKWSDTSITLQLPPGSGSFPLSPGTATISVDVGGQSSNTQTITVTS